MLQVLHIIFKQTLSSDHQETDGSGGIKIGMFNMAF